ncbi:MAG: chemotaxis protein CheW [Sedimentibacter sp.]|uniref:chemotaxis protein CheW n=1 Tax=Sedimentibacter sp. TaxID=1960295 RepID=UPI002980B6AA|nr:chemotaxis protein CheW [Sedimentibacter sp.]MDW5300106.1 chemotaxis protein CheW [Sedimentibacter sp.]
MQDRINIISDENLGEDTLKNKYLTFYTENQLFGIPIADVVQIVGMQDITTVPEFPNYAKGVINLRGTIIPIVDVRLRLKKEEKEYDERTCIIVTNINDSFIGFIVDSVDEVAKIFEDNISNPPKMGSDYINTYITGIAKLDNKIVLLINLKKMLSEKEIELITKLD